MSVSVLYGYYIHKEEKPSYSYEHEKYIGFVLILSRFELFVTLIPRWKAVPGSLKGNEANEEEMILKFDLNFS